MEESPQTPRLAEPPSKSLLESERPEPANSEDVEFDEAELPDASATGPYARESFGIYRCATNRPSVCDALVSPVCARRLVSPHDDAGAETVANYSNGCLACSDPSVVSYVFGRCDYRRPSTLAAPTATTEKR